MKFSLIAAIALACTQVGANPLRIIFASRTASQVSPFRVGLAGASAIAGAHSNNTNLLVATPHGHAPHFSKKKGCGGMRNPVVTISNWIKIKFGLPVIEGHTPDHQAEVHGNHPPSPHITTIHHVKLIPVAVGSNRYFHPSDGFFGRLHQALMSLGPWEGRAVAFVFGCGIGSLLRMFWVFAVIAFRSSKPQESLGDDAETEVLYDQEAEEVRLAPPKYSDEKRGTEIKTSA